MHSIHKLIGGYPHEIIHIPKGPDELSNDKD